MFALTLVITPLSVLLWGLAPGLLPFLPSDDAVRGAVLLNIAAFLTFSIGYSLSARRRRAVLLDRNSPKSQWLSSVWIAVPFLLVGYLGFALRYNSFAVVIDLFANPGARRDILYSLSEPTLKTAASTFLLPFLGFGFVIAWANWMDRQAKRRILRQLSGTLLFGGLVLGSYALFAYNRGSFVAPLTAMAAVGLSRARKVSLPLTVASGGIALVLLFAFGNYRASNITAGELMSSSSARSELLRAGDPIQTLQVYCAAPQFLGYFLDVVVRERPLTLGHTTVSSLLYPVPVFGKPLRPTSGTSLYNMAIRGIGVVDQVTPAIGEVFLDFHVFGVIGAFLLLGHLIWRLQQTFENAITSIQAYIAQYVSIWLAFSIVGSLEVVSQVFVFMFWPVYLYLGLSTLRQRAGRPLAPAVAPTPRFSRAVGF